MNISLFSIFSILSLLLGQSCFAQNQPAKSSTIRITGRDSATVTTDRVRLRDIADVSSSLVNDQDIIIALKKIEIDASPKPGEQATLAASRIIERLRQERVNLNDLIYVFPRVIKLERAARALTKAEIDAALSQALTKMGRDLTIRSIDLKEELYVPPAAQEIKATPYNTNKPGIMGFNLVASSPGDGETRYQITAQVDELLEVPTARYALPKGRRIQSEDLMMARLNIASLPNDTAYKSNEIIGQEINGEIQYGETFRKTRMITPPLVTAGARVVMFYKAGALEASATGTALDSGILGQEIRVKNDNSKKIITGKILDGGKIGVNP